MTKAAKSALPTIIAAGALWGIFEATVGYALHLFPWKIGSYVWFPAAYFFMDRVFQSTRKRRAVVAAAVLTSAIKLLNLLSPIRPDYVINPAVSIVLEAFAMTAVLGVATLHGKHSHRLTAVGVLAVNTLWRLMYTLYLAFLVPVWMRDASVIRGAEAYLSFILSENLISAAVCAAFLGAYGLLERKLPHFRATANFNAARYAVAAVLLCCSVLLQFAL